jgi:hypothetical protein
MLLHTLAGLPLLQKDHFLQEQNCRQQHVFEPVATAIDDADAPACKAATCVLPALVGMMVGELRGVGAAAIISCAATACNGKLVEIAPTSRCKARS